MPCASNRNASANDAILGTVDRNSVTPVGAPVYTSGTHMWNGTAPNLNATATTRNTRPRITPRLGSPVAIVGQLVELERAGQSVDQRHAIQQHSRRDRAEQEVLHRGLGGDAVLAIERDHRVQRERHAARRRCRRSAGCSPRRARRCRAATSARARSTRRASCRAARGTRANTAARPRSSGNRTASASPRADPRRSSRRTAARARSTLAYINVISAPTASSTSVNVGARPWRFSPKNTSTSSSRQIAPVR